MSLMNTVTKMAIGFAMAKGMDAIQKNGGVGQMMEGLTKAGGGSSTGGMGGLSDIMGQLTGGGAAQTAGMGGGLGGMLGQLTGGTAGGAAAGGLGGLGGLLGGIAGARGGAAGGGLESLLAADNPAQEPDETEVATLMIRAMVQAAQSDGAIDAGERENLMKVMQDGDPSDVQMVQQLLDAPVDAAALAADTPKGLETQVYTMAVNAITPDNQAEAQFLHELGTGLGIAPETSNQIHKSLGATPLYG